MIQNLFIKQKVKKIIINKIVIISSTYFNQKQREIKKQSTEIDGLKDKKNDKWIKFVFLWFFLKNKMKKRKNIIAIDFDDGSIYLTLLNIEKNKTSIYLFWYYILFL